MLANVGAQSFAVQLCQTWSVPLDTPTITLVFQCQLLNQCANHSPSRFSLKLSLSSEVPAQGKLIEDEAGIRQWCAEDSLATKG